MTTVYVNGTRVVPNNTVYIDPNSDLIRKKEPIFTAKPAANDLTGAQAYLSLVCPADVVSALVAKLKSTKVTKARANDILRAAKLHPADDKDPGVQKETGNIKDETPLAPVLLIQGDAFRGIPLLIADGFHRTTAAYLRDPDAVVSVVLAQVDWSALEAPTRVQG